MKTSPNLRAALQNFATNQHHNARGGVVYLIEEKEYATFGYAVYQPDMVGFEEISDAAALAAFALVTELVGSPSRNQLEILFARLEPHDLAPYHRAFGAGAKSKLTFNSHQTAVVLPRKLSIGHFPKRALMS